MLSICILIASILLLIAAAKLTRRKFFFFAATGIFSILLLEAVLYGYFIYLIYTARCFYLIDNQKVLDALIKLRMSYATYFAQGRKNFVYRLDDDLGWSVGKDKDSGLYRTNRDGVRARREYMLVPGQKTLRVAAFGDSFVFCDGEKNEDTWPYLLENSASNLEVLNFGVSGYGLGQSYLRFLKDGLKFNPDVVFINYLFTSERDGIYPKYFIQPSNLRQANYYSVRFDMEDGKLNTKATTPFEQFDPAFRQKFIFDPVGYQAGEGLFASKFFSNTNTGLFIKARALPKLLVKKTDAMELPRNAEVNELILQNLVEVVKRQGAAIVFFYNMEFDELPEKIRSILNSGGPHVVYVNGTGRFNALIRETGLENTNLKNSSAHYNAQGNALYAQTVLDVLKSRQWGAGQRRFTYNPKDNAFVNTAR